MQLIAAGGTTPFRYSSFTKDSTGALYLAFQDGVDQSLRVAIGRPAAAGQSTAAQKKGNE